MQIQLQSLKKLYVIGNGFDMHHKIKCKYLDFRKWLHKTRPEVYNNLAWLYGRMSGEWWRSFEESLTEFKPNTYPRKIAKMGFMTQLDFLVDKYGQEWRDFMDSYEDSMSNNGGVTDKYQRIAAIARFEMQHLKDDLFESFGEWVKTLMIPKAAPKVRIDKKAIFFTFNYTRTLEDLYGIEEKQIVHLHGSVDNNKFVIGHSMTAEEMKNKDLIEHAIHRNPDRNYGADEARLAMFEVIEDELKKPVDDIMYRYRNDFNSLVGVKEVEILGLSYSPIDLPYLRNIFDITGTDVKVRLGWHSKDYDKKNAKEFAKEMKLTNYRLKKF